MQERTREDILGKVKKLLSKTTENGCTEAESGAAFAMASRILAEHNLDLAEFQAMSSAEPSAWVDEPFFETQKWELQDNLIYGILRRFFFVEMHSVQEGRVKTLYIFGTKENVEVGKYTWNALEAAFERHWMMHRITRNLPASERRMFVVGMAQGFTDKLADERKAMEAERDLCGGGTGTALAVLNIEGQIEKAMSNANPGSKPQGGRFVSPCGPQSTFDAGHAAGRSLNINRALDGRGRKGIGDS